MKKLNEQEQKFLAEKEKALKEFLDAHPEAAKHQEDIDMILNTCNQTERMEIIFTLLTGKFINFSDEIKKLADNYKK